MFHVAESMGFNGDSRQWEQLLRIRRLITGYRCPFSNNKAANFRQCFVEVNIAIVATPTAPVVEDTCGLARQSSGERIFNTYSPLWISMTETVFATRFLRRSSKTQERCRAHAVTGRAKRTNRFGG
jgi:hypothetical protein